MVHLASLLAQSTLAASVLTVSAHPGVAHHASTPDQLEQRKLFMDNSKRLLQNCADSDAARRLTERTVARRAESLDNLRRDRSRRLGMATALATDHQSNLTGLAADTNPSELFGGNVSCILEPEVTQGPYYVSGELVRNDVREDQAGVDLYADLQIIDVNTCEPVEGLYLDFWHCNATGVYSGIIANGNGDSSDASNVNNTFLRGLTPTDADGFTSFTTIFPGHYTGRATHIHVLGTYNGTLLDNNTYSGGYSSHVGQIFFDQDLISQVETTSPYSDNAQTLTTNEEDTIFSQSAADTFDPVVEYALLGDDVSEGILAWISIGIDMTRAEVISPAGELTSDGGVQYASTSANGGAPGGMGGGSFTGGKNTMQYSPAASGSGCPMSA
jgi:protocatechuate 3,4-dioxygenase beta subunit